MKQLIKITPKENPKLFDYLEAFTASIFSEKLLNK